MKVRETCLFSLPIKEFEITVFLLGASFKGVSSCPLRGYHLGQAFHRPCVGRVLKEQDWQTSHHPTQGDCPSSSVLVSPSLAPEKLESFLILCTRNYCCHPVLMTECFTSARGCTATLANFTKTTLIPSPRDTPT
ncbi:hypothetical protein U0070_001739 [Myodes glareolus]|uniref:Uncharacterized protein n=1 Tax=Myodes glareolus TaxID=447135 RepID=A0AAW0JBK5_MYOGA